jgi:alpha-mannosidase
MTMYHNLRRTSKKLAQRLSLIENLVYRRVLALPLFCYLELGGPERTPPVEAEINIDDWEVIEPNTYWGKPGTDFVLRTSFQVPATWSTDEAIALHLPLGVAGDFSHPEALAYIDGKPYAACDRHHQEILLAEAFRDGAEHILVLHGWTGITRDDDQRRMRMYPCSLVQIHQPTRDFLAQSRVALGIADALPEENPTRAHLFNALDDSFKVIDIREPIGDSFYRSISHAQEVLKRGIKHSGAPLDVHITAVGHAHIDVAWLWPLAQTRRKAGRTFCNVTHFMEHFPEFIFAQSQPQLYEFVRQDYPDLFETLRQRIAVGQWEPIGGMWVEADCNLSGGESLVRHFLLGKEFFKEYFGEGADSPVLWLPDVFGYAWNLPQLIKGAGLKYFFTIKIGWSQYNRLPYDTFWWQGLDGTRVLTHFSPTRESGASFVSTYNAQATPFEALSTWRNFQQKDWGKTGQIPPLLMSYGHGDGGGGPTRQMLENIRHMEAFPATPQVRPGKVGDFFQDLEETVGDRLPVWNGELYLEYHRGTYTTQSRNKRANRKGEFLLHDAEFLATLANTIDIDFIYPHNEIRQAWELICLNQFHDILPGSSIGEVYTESLAQYAEVEKLGNRVLLSALRAIASQVGGDLLIVNPTSFKRNDLVTIKKQGKDFENITLQHQDGYPVRMQTIEGGYLLGPGVLPPYSITTFITAASGNRNGNEDAGKDLFVTPELLENDFLRVEINAQGDISRIYDNQNRREVLPPGSVVNQFQAFEDRPNTPDAWEIDIFYDEKMWLAEDAESIEVLEDGPLRSSIEIRRRVLNSEIIQRISLSHNSPRLDFDTVVHWRERHILLKTAFPTEILSPAATYEIQWGNVQRPTHRNTSWDWARFETCAQKWVDLSEGDYGVSLLNDCKYGHDIHENIIRLTLLRGPTDPDPEADLGEHHFTYSLLPHSGPWGLETVREAYSLNDPLIAYAVNMESHRDTKITGAFVKVNQPNVVIETVKKAQDGEGIIVRLYECQRARGNFTLTTGFSIRQAWLTNLLEENLEELTVDGNQMTLAIKPYQILTIRLLPD